MAARELQNYLNQKYQKRDSFMENVLNPIFKGISFEDAYDIEMLEDEDLHGIASRSGVESVIKYGTFEVPHNPVEIFDITVSDRVMMRRNRVGIQQIIHRILGTFSSAFIIFHYSREDAWDWRFTFCHKDDKMVTESKRYTFILGPGQSCRTAAENFKALIDKNGEIGREDLINAFNVEALSKEFFDKYKWHYERFCQYVYDNKNNRKYFGEEFSIWEEKIIRDYVKKLLGRIVFLHFLQKKGWMGVPSDKQWGDGDTQFMKHLFEASTQEQKANYLDEVLEPLFNETLNKQRENDLATLDVEGFKSTKIPYLNGGLFERDYLDEPKSVFPAEFFEDLFEFMYQYNFTIDENDPNDAEVGIDPEMLGRIFENLLEDNKDKGAFYTPKEIVQYMCRESLIAYLTACVIKKQGDNHHSEEQIQSAVRELLQNPDTIVPKMTKQQLDDFGSYIRNVKICDPAIGSGAFPMGLLNELVRCRTSIDAWAMDENGKQLTGDYAALKSEIICNNIYGVDIEKGAIDIARLRFWLSIVVDEQTPHALPNFDYKFMRGNSLIPTFGGQYINLSTQKQQPELVGKMISIKKKILELKRQFYVSSGKEKLELDIKIKDHILQLISLRLGYEIKSWAEAHVEQYSLEFPDEQEITVKKAVEILPEERKRIVDLGRRLREKLADESLTLEQRAQTDIKFFDWRMMFTEVFDVEDNDGGFDIVIANPPYIDSESMANQGMDELRKILKSQYLCLEGNWDIYMAFLEFSLSIARIVVFITPDKWLSKPFGKKFRGTRMIDRMTSITRAGSKVFENAKVDAIISLFTQKSNLASVNEFVFKNNSVQIENKGTHSIKELQDPFLIDFLFADNIDVVVRMDMQNGRLKELAECEGACATSDAYKLQPLVNNNQNPDYTTEYIVINTGTISKYYNRWGISPMKYLGDSYLYPVVNKKTFEKKFGTTYVKRAKRPKIIFKGLNLLDVCLDDEAIILPAKTTNVICSEDINLLKFLCGILNSRLIFYYIKLKYGSSSYCGGITFTKDMVNYLPVNIEADKTSIVELVNRIINIKKQNPTADTSSLEHEIDLLVYKLYDLTPEEIAIVENSTK